MLSRGNDTSLIAGRLSLPPPGSPPQAPGPQPQAPGWLPRTPGSPGPPGPPLTSGFGSLGRSRFSGAQHAENLISARASEKQIGANRGHQSSAIITVRVDKRCK